MAMFQWNEELYGTGIVEIDSQHKRMVEMANELYGALTRLEGETTCRRLLNDLVEYTAHHFETEEGLMGQCEYPGAEDHHDEHERLKSELEDFRNAHLAGRKWLSVELIDFLTSWLVEHTAAADREFSQFYKKFRQDTDPASPE